MERYVLLFWGEVVVVSVEFSANGQPLAGCVRERGTGGDFSSQT